jgi:hypothetical protein
MKKSFMQPDFSQIIALSHHRWTSDSKKGDTWEIR